MADQSVTFGGRRCRGNQQRNEPASFGDFNGFAPLDLIEVAARVLAKLPDSDSFYVSSVAH